MVNQIANHPAVQRVIALGTLFAMELHVDGKNAGYHPFSLICSFTNLMLPSKIITSKKKTNGRNNKEKEKSLPPERSD